MKQTNSYAHILKYISVFGSVQGINIAISLVRNKCVAMLLGPAGVGLISIYNNAATLLQNATSFGLQISGVRDVAKAFDDGDEAALAQHISVLRSWSLLIALFGFVVTLAVSSPLGVWFHTADHQLHFIFLAPIVAMAALTGCETAILKATRRLNALAKISVCGVVGSLLVTVPIYIRWRFNGIIPSLLLIAVVQMVLAMAYSYKAYPLSINLRRDLSQGRSLLTIGVAFVVAGVISSGAELVIRDFLSGKGLSEVGLYNTGYMLTMTYAGMVFAAMETDYFPHLSAVCHDRRRMIGAVNRQVEMSLMIVSPLLVCLMVALPVVVPLLYSGEFAGVVPMAQVAVMAMYFRATNLPVAYCVLAKGEPKAYLALELACGAITVGTVIGGYHLLGLLGTGIAIAISETLYFLLEYTYCTRRYRIFFSRKLIAFIVPQMLIGMAALAVVMTTSSWTYCALGAVLIALSAWLSYRKFRHRIWRSRG